MIFRRAMVIVFVLAFAGALWVGCADKKQPPTPRESTGEMPEPTRVELEPKNTDGLHIVMAGDTMLDDLAMPYLLKYGWEYSLAELGKLFATADLVGLNLEVPVARRCRRSKIKKYAYSMLPEALAGLKNNGVHMVNLANNHYRDCGKSGKKSTIKHLDNWGLWHFGGGVTEQEADRPLIVELGDTTVGLLGFYGYFGNYRRHGTAQLTESNIARLVGGLRPLVDVLIVNVHWGQNYAVEVDAKQQRLGRLLIEHGADAVVGHGAHIPQEMELYLDKPLLYSIGNGAFGTGNNAARESLLAEFIVRGGAIDELRVHPIFNQNRNLGVKWQPRLATGQKATRTLRKFTSRSARRGAEFTLQDDQAILALPAAP
jgi:poly-gamma-glutamate capsule biosynthesis protein CapA/YwtB (metallophosphatase superfamily)